MIRFFIVFSIFFITLQADEQNIKEQKLKILRELNTTLNSGDTKKIYKTYKKLANLYTQNGEYYKSIEYYKLAIKLYRTTENPDDKVKVSLYKNLAFCYRKIGNTFKSFKYAYMAVNLANKTYGKNSQVAKNLNKEIKNLQSRLIEASI